MDSLPYAICHNFHGMQSSGCSHTSPKTLKHTKAVCQGDHPPRLLGARFPVQAMQAAPEFWQRISSQQPMAHCGAAAPQRASLPLHDATRVQLGGTGNSSSDVAFAAVAAGRYHSAALSKDGHIFTWGLNDYGQLGRGAATPEGVGAVCIMSCCMVWLLCRRADQACMLVCRRCRACDAAAQRCWSAVGYLV